MLILHQVSRLHLSVLVQLLQVLVDCTAAIIMSPNDRASHTIAGTNTSPINSFSVKVSLFSPIILDPATN